MSATLIALLLLIFPIALCSLFSCARGTFLLQLQAQAKAKGRQRGATFSVAPSTSHLSLSPTKADASEAPKWKDPTQKRRCVRVWVCEKREGIVCLLLSLCLTRVEPSHLPLFLHFSFPPSSSLFLLFLVCARPRRKWSEVESDTPDTIIDTACTREGYHLEQGAPSLAFLSLSLSCDPKRRERHI